MDIISQVSPGQPDEAKILFDDGGANSDFTIRINELEVPILSASNTFTNPNILPAYRILEP